MSFNFHAIWTNSNCFDRAVIAQLVEHPTEKPGTVLMQVWVSGAARDCSPRVSFQCRSLIFQYPCSPSVQSHASTSVRTLKIPSIGSQTFVWTHENTALTDRNGQCCSCSCCDSGKTTQISSKGQYLMLSAGAGRIGSPVKGDVYFQQGTVRYPI